MISNVAACRLGQLMSFGSQLNAACHSVALSRLLVGHFYVLCHVGHGAAVSAAHLCLGFVLDLRHICPLLAREAPVDADGVFSSLKGLM